MAPIVCHLNKLGIIETVALYQVPVFQSAVQFARAEGIVPAPEPAHAIKVVIDEALKCRESGEAKTILLALSGHGHFDLAACDSYLSGQLEDYEYPEEKVEEALYIVPRGGYDVAEMELVAEMLTGRQQALSRLITLVEKDAAELPQIMREVYPHTGKGYCIGVTGPPGGGKSTLVDRLTAIARSQGLTVGIVAVDPTSPFSGGAFLGDRIRMQQHYLDNGVFIRSMATRGSHGGLPQAAKAVIKLLDAFGKNLILVETVGVGQTELDIMEAVDTRVVVLFPGAGDSIQTMKAGLMEIADIFVVNKADRQGAGQLVAELEAMLLSNPKGAEWQVPVLATQATNDAGTSELYQEIERHRGYLEASGQLRQRRQQQRKEELLQAIQQRLREPLSRLLEQDQRLIALAEGVKRGELDPYSAAAEVLRNKAILRDLLS